jgi:NAD+ synthase (glutamine-hydrolysing)
VQWYGNKEKNREISSALFDILATPVSPELLPPSSSDEISQKTEDLIGPYELHDFFLYNMVRQGFNPRKILYLSIVAFKGKFSSAEILKWLRIFYRRFFTQQFKRSCVPDGPKVGSVALSPRGDWRMPSDASFSLWLNELEDLDPEKWKNQLKY